MAYRLEGSILEVCSCNVICPCWVGQTPDGGVCEAALTYHVDSGTIDGVDVGGLSLSMMAYIRGSVLDGNWRTVFFVDDRATPEQGKALADVFSGKLGGPLEHLGELMGEVVAVERAPITFEVVKGKGHMQIGAAAEAEVEGFVGATDQPTTLQDTLFSNIPGSPAYVARAPTFKAQNATLGIDLDLQGHSAVQGSFLFES